MPRGWTRRLFYILKSSLPLATEACFQRNCATSLLRNWNCLPHDVPNQRNEISQVFILEVPLSLSQAEIKAVSERTRSRTEFKSWKAHLSVVVNLCQQPLYLCLWSARFRYPFLIWSSLKFFNSRWNGIWRKNEKSKARQRGLQRENDIYLSYIRLGDLQIKVL